MRLNEKKGAILITLIVAMVLMAALGIGVYTLTTSSTFSELLSNSNDKAFELARAGIRYGNNLVANKPATYTYPTTTFNMPDADHTFTIAINNVGSTKVVTSTGVVNPGSFRAASRTLTYALAYSMSTYSIGFPTDMPGFASPNISNPGDPSGEQAIQVDQVNKIVNAGGGVGNEYGTLVYKGNSTVANCVNGACDFGLGIRAYFEFTFLNEDKNANSTDFADGFTFLVMSAINNTNDRSGGAPGPTSMGELMGYAGAGNTVGMAQHPGEGLVPPKMALEFDTYPNPNTGNICAAEGRNDGSGSNSGNHAALIFWGADTASGSGCVGSGNSYDDNTHNVGSPRNSNVSGSSSSGYYRGADMSCRTTGTCRWMEDTYKYSARIEIVRPAMPTSGNYNYEIKAWILRELAGFPADQQGRFKDLSVPYTDSASHVSRTGASAVSLTATQHSDFRKMFFGFTEATGGKYQQVRWEALNVFFPLAALECTYSLVPPSYDAPAAGATGQTVSVNSSNGGCPWTAVSNDPSWISITTGAAGVGNGTVTYNVAANNTGIARTGTMTIAGQTFTVTQAAPPTCTLTPSATVVAYNSTVDLTWTIANGPATTASFSPTSGTCTNNVNGSGDTCTTANQTTPGARTYTLTVSNANGSSSCSTTINVGCQNYQVWNGFTNQRDFWVGTQCANDIGSGNEITTTTRRLDPGETITRLTNSGTCGGTAGNVLDYNDAMNVDVAGDDDCRVNFTGNHTATDR